VIDEQRKKANINAIITLKITKQMIFKGEVFISLSLQAIRAATIGNARITTQ